MQSKWLIFHFYVQFTGVYPEHFGKISPKVSSSNQTSGNFGCIGQICEQSSDIKGEHVIPYTLKKWRPSDFGGILLGFFGGIPFQWTISDPAAWIFLGWWEVFRSAAQRLRIPSDWRLDIFSLPKRGSPMAAYQRGLQATYPRDDPPRSSKWSLKFPRLGHQHLYFWHLETHRLNASSVSVFQWEDGETKSMGKMCIPKTIEKTYECW